ncbi:tetratricopeptide repeat protein [uncultured Microscilla sp.]|uniref:tetratricopeptide repeat protein n=1 Tax=uncultured Microscilla sp. TaxID=432653 RepID=UPI00260DD240|nr:tetratricopeptide repeat protein [uncultured Microscilla sp.]
MKKLFICLIVCMGCFLNPAQAQNDSIPLLEKKLATLKNKPRVDVLNQLAQAYKIKEVLDKAKSYAKEAEQLAKSLGYKAGIAESYHQQGALLAIQKKYKESIVKFDKSFQLFEELKLAKKAATLLKKLGGAYFYNQEMAKATVYVKQAEKRFQKLNEPEELVEIQLHLGILYNQQGKLDLALENYQKVKKWYQKKQDTKSVANIMVNISEVYFKQKDLKNTINALYYSYQLFTKLEMVPQRVTIAERLGYSYRLAEKHDSSAYYLQQALNLRPDTPTHAQARASLYKQLSGAYYYQKKFTKAIDCNLRVIKHLESLPDNKEASELLMDEYVNVGILYKTIGEYDKSLESYNKGLELRKKHNKTKDISYILVNMGEVYLAQKNYSESLKSFSQSLKMKEAKKDTARMLAVLGHLNDLYRAMKDYRRTGGIMEKMYKLRQESSKFKLTEENKREFFKELSMVYYKAENFEKVYFYQSKLLTLYKGEADERLKAQSLFNLGMCSEKLQRRSEAIDYYQKSYKILKKLDDKEAMAQVAYNMASSYNELKNYMKAIEQLKNTLAIREELQQKKMIIVISNDIAQLYIQQKKYKEAIPYLKKADEYVEKPAQEVAILERLTLCHVKLEDHNKALEYAQELIKLKPKKDSYRNNEGLILIKQKKYKEAIGSMSKAIELGTDPNYYFTRANLYLQTGQPTKAVEDYNACLDKVGNSAILYSARAYAYVKANQLDKAETDLKKATELDQTLAMLQFSRAAYFMAKNQPDKAIDSLERAVKQGFKEKEKITTEKLFAPLKDKEKFKKLMRELGS